MAFALTLVASKDKLSAGHIAKAQDMLSNFKLTCERQPSWLSQHKAADMILSDCPSLEQMDLLRSIFADDAIDVLCTSTLNRRKKLLCADMESTIIKNEMLEELAESLGLKEKIAAITQRSMNGEINFTQSLIERAAMLEGLPEKTLADLIPTLKINEGAKTLVATMKANGAVCTLITGGFTFYSDIIAKQVGFDHHHANVLEIDKGALTGRLVGDILNPNSKLHFLEMYCRTLNIKDQMALAIGDGANDIPMLLAAGLGIGYYPKPKVQEIMLNQIIFGDFTTVLYAQGYKEDEFIRA